MNGVFLLCTKMTDAPIQGEGEKLFPEQARAHYRGIRHAAQNVSIGKIISRTVRRFCFTRHVQIVVYRLYRGTCILLP